jgi:hypothetical protein
MGTPSTTRKSKMKTILLILLSITLLHAEDWTTTTGKIFHSVSVVKVMPTSVIITSTEGTAIVHLADLPAALQKKFGYDPVALATADNQRAKDVAAIEALAKQKKARESIEAQAVLIDGVVLNKDANGVLLVECIAPEPVHIDETDMRGAMSSGTIKQLQAPAQKPPGPTPIYGTFFLRDARSDLTTGDAVKLAAYPDGQYTDSFGRNYHAYTVKHP